VNTLNGNVIFVIIIGILFFGMVAAQCMIDDRREKWRKDRFDRHVMGLDKRTEENMDKLFGKDGDNGKV